MGRRGYGHTEEGCAAASHGHHALSAGHWTGESTFFHCLALLGSAPAFNPALLAIPNRTCVVVEKKIHHLSVYLVKPAYSTSEQVIQGDACDEPINVPIAGHGSGKLYIQKTRPRPPRWASLFEELIDFKKLAVPGVSAAFFIKAHGHCFVLTFGQGRHLLKEDVFEERFGLLCALNSVDPKTFRCVDVQSLDAIDSHTRIQSGQETTPEQFGLNVEQDMLKAIVGKPTNPSLGNRMTGSDSLSVSVKMGLSDLPYLLDQYRQQFESELSPEDHQWVNNIAPIKSSAVISELEHALDESLSAGQLDGIWLSIPEIIEWSTVAGFTYTHGGKEIHSDINFAGFQKTLNGHPMTLDLLRARKVHCADADHNPTFRSWSLFKCLYAEVDLDGVKYVLNDGKWFRVAADFVVKTDAEFNDIPHSKLTLPEYKGGGEGAYNDSIAKADPSTFCCLDADPVPHGGPHGKVEVCDLLSANRDLIHVKIYSKSSVLSHLFAQGSVSGQLIKTDADFRKKVRMKLRAPFCDFFDEEPRHDVFTIVYAVISEHKGGLHLPFFSRVNLNNTRRMLRGYGYKVELLKINVDESYAKTTKCPPKGKGKETWSIEMPV